jgi:hypothetical protein
MVQETTKEEVQETVALALQITHVVEREETMEIPEALTGIAVELITTTIITITASKDAVTSISQGVHHPHDVDLAMIIAQGTALQIATMAEEEVAHAHRAVTVVE